MIRVSRRRSCLVVRAGDGTREVDLKVVVGKVAFRGGEKRVSEASEYRAEYEVYHEMFET